MAENALSRNSLPGLLFQVSFVVKSALFEGQLRLSSNVLMSKEASFNEPTTRDPSFCIEALKFIEYIEVNRGSIAATPVDAALRFFGDIALVQVNTLMYEATSQISLTLKTKSAGTYVRYSADLLSRSFRIWNKCI